MVQQTRAELQSLKDINLASGQTLGITGVKHREVLGNEIDSAFNKLSDDYTNVPGLVDQLATVPGNITGILNIARTRVAGDITTDRTTSLWAITDTSVPRTFTIGSVDEVAVDDIIDIVDESLNAGVNNITVTTESGSLIEGQASIVIMADGGGIRLQWTGTFWKDQT